MVLALALASTTLLVHDVGRITSQSYFLDEAWVALSTQQPVEDAPSLTSSSPLGWTLLLRLAVVGGPERHRLVPLLMLVAAALLAYAIGRRAPLAPALGGSLAAVAVVLLPHALVRNDLKQYTTDAACSLLLLLLTARAEERPTSGRLWAVAATAPAAMLVGTASAFVSAACFLGLLVAAAVRRDARRTRAVVVSGAAAAAGLTVVYLVAVRPHVNTALDAYWADWFLPLGDPVAAAGTAAANWDELQRLSNLGPWWSALLVLAGGVATLASARRWALAATIPLLLVVVAVASGFRRYPFLDQRTSFFLFVVLAVTAAFAAAGAARAVSALVTRALSARPGGAGRRQDVPAAAAATVLVLAVAAYAVVPVTSYLRASSIPEEDVESATAWADARRGPDDVVVVNAGAQYGYAYYSTSFHARIAFVPRSAVGFVVADDPGARVLVAYGPEQRLRDTLAAAGKLVRGDGLVYVVRAHDHRTDRQILDRLPTVERPRWPGASVQVIAGAALVTGG